MFLRTLLTVVGLATFIVASGRGASEPYLDPDRPIADRVEDLLGRMTLEEKASQLVSRTAPIARLGIPALIWDNEGKHAFVTCFPASIGIAATWDPSLAERIASAIADEGRAKNNENVKRGAIQRYLSFWAPTINIARDPRWGRTNESFGEDPWLTSQLAVAFIHGMQGDDPHYLKAAAGVNHFAVYNEERDRHSVDVTLEDERLLRDYYLPHFQASIEQGHAAAVGATNNGLNGVPLCMNRFMLTNILRQEWGFRGFVFSDAASVEDIYGLRHLAASGAEAAALTIHAGCEVNTGRVGTHQRFLPEAVRKGLIPEAEVTEACRRTLTVEFRLGLFDPPARVPYSRIPKSVMDSPEHRALAREAADASIVLLKNDGRLLPLDVKRLKRILIAGPRADQPELGRKQTGSSAHNVSALEGIRQKATRAGVEVVYEKDPQASIAAAKGADVVLFFTSVKEGEVADRMDLHLAPRQENQLRALIATKVPVVVVLIAGGCTLMERWIDQVPAVLAAWYPGEEGGDAIADVLFGDVNPSGKLPLTFYRSADQLLPFDEFDIRKGTTYWYAASPVQFPFGHGLSYTTFAYSNLRIAPVTTPEGGFAIAVDVTNTGGRAGAEVAQLYLHAQRRSTNDQPLEQLRGFEKVQLAKGETRVVRWTLRPADLAFHDRDLNFVVEPGIYDVRVGSSSGDIRVRGSLDVPERTVLRPGAELRYGNLVLTPKNVKSDEPIELAVDVTNAGQVTGAPSVRVDGKLEPTRRIPIGPGETQRVALELRLWQPGEHHVTVGGQSSVVTVTAEPARLAYSGLQVPPVAAMGTPIAVTIEAQNVGGETGHFDSALLEDGAPNQSQAVTLAPGERRTLVFHPTLSVPGDHAVSIGDQPPNTVQVGGPVVAPFRTFATTPTAEFFQSGPHDFFIRAIGALGGSAVGNNSGALATWDSYGTVYVPGGMPEQCVVTVKIRSQELVSNYTKSGIMIRNRITAPGQSPGYLICGINGYYGGNGIIEWDAEGTGYLQTIASYGAGTFPKYVKVERNGRHYRVFTSHDGGQTWMLGGQVDLPSAAPIQDVGLFVASDMEERAALARFADFTIAPGLFNGPYHEAKPPAAPKLEQPL